MAQFRAELLDGVGFELPAPLPAHTNEVQRVRSKAANRAHKLFRTLLSKGCEKGKTRKAC